MIELYSVFVGRVSLSSDRSGMKTKRDVDIPLSFIINAISSTLSVYMGVCSEVAWKARLILQYVGQYVYNY